MITDRQLYRYAHLPLVVARSEPERARPVLEMLGREPDLARRVRALIEVGGRRWNIRIDNGIDVRLPEAEPAAAWSELAQLDRRHALLARRISTIDLRIPSRIVVTPVEETGKKEGEALMAKPRSGMLTALDIGTSKIACLVAESGTPGEVRVLGVGHHASRGVRGGAIVNMDAAEAAILTAVSAAEERVGERLHGVVINVSAGRPNSRNLSVEVEIDGHEVGDADLRRIYGQGLEHNGHAERELIHCIPVSHHIDGSSGIKDPRGMYGQRLSVDMHLVSAEAAALRNMITCVARCHLDVEDVVVSPYAAGLACLVEDELDLGATVVDMGGGTTNVAVFYGGQVVHAEVVQIGGDHVTRDIARGLTTSLVHAERIKVLYGSALPRRRTITR